MNYCYLLIFLLSYGTPALCRAEDRLPAIFKTAFVVGGQFYDYQDYHNVPYFHGGLDLCAPAGTEVYTPVSGKVAVNDYKITASAEPHRFSYARQPFKQGEYSRTRYLEVAITTTDGKTYMFRHIDPISIPSEVFRCAELQTPIKDGTMIGRVAMWLDPVLPEKQLFDHIHLEIQDSEGNYLNPASYVKTTRDYYPPELHNLYAVTHDSSTAIELKSTSENLISGNIDLIAAVTDRMNRAAYRHSIFTASWSLHQIASDGTSIAIDHQEAFRFDRLPFKGERVQLSKVIYRQYLNVGATKIQANGSRGPRFFLINLTSGTTQAGYSSQNCLKTEKYPTGLYQLQVLIEDRAGNRRQQSYSVRIHN